jgi:hypothetical protein
MKIKPAIKLSALPFLVLGAGGTGLVLRVLLYTLGEDSRGLLPRWHYLHILTLLLTVVVTAGLLHTIWGLAGSSRYKKNFPASVPAGISTILCAGWMLLYAFSALERITSKLDSLLVILAFACVPCLVVTGLCRIRGKRPFFGFHAILCVFCIIHLLNQYRVWSGNPQLPDYLFQIFACISLTLTAYYRTAFDLGMGRRRLYLFSNLMAVYLCFLSLVGSGDGRFYFGGGVWALANLCVLDPPPRQVKPDTIRIPTDPERM